MIKIADPHGILSGAATVAVQTPIVLEAETLGDAVRFAEKQFDLRIQPETGGRYFRIESGTESDTEAPPVIVDAEGDSCAGLTDIHIQRGAEQLCPKQDFAYPLQSGDEVVFEVLLC
jgi:hypothetical protein